MLNDDISRYIALHRSLGFKFRSQSCLLQHFATFAAYRGDDCVRTDSVVAWAKEAPSAAQRRNRLLTVRRFAQHMQTEDERYEVPPAHVFGRSEKRRRMPHIYTPEEIRSLLRAAAHLGPPASLRPATYVTLIALIASTGMRISEVLALRLDDVTAAGLVIRNTKFRKNRLVPLHPSARSGLERYLARRAKAHAADDAIFVSQWGTGLHYSTVCTVFRQLVRAIGVHGRPGRRGPCLHDLRHTFAVRALESCGSDDRDVARHMLALSTYLGHAHTFDTYWYLQATPKLMEHIASAGETLFAGGER
jgi:integrase